MLNSTPKRLDAAYRVKGGIATSILERQSFPQVNGAASKMGHLAASRWGNGGGLIATSGWLSLPAIDAGKTGVPSRGP